MRENGIEQETRKRRRSKDKGRKKERTEVRGKRVGEKSVHEDEEKQK
jgi:hypothetical protein